LLGLQVDKHLKQTGHQLLIIYIALCHSSIVFAASLLNTRTSTVHQFQCWFSDNHCCSLVCRFRP
jgi:hypothetical protein